MRALGHGGIPRYGVLRRDRGDAVLVAERDGEQERGFTQGVCVCVRDGDYSVIVVVVRWSLVITVSVRSVRRSVRPLDAFVVDWITSCVHARRDATV